MKSLDIGVNRSFKSHFEEYICDNSNFDSNGKLTKMTINQMTKWIGDAAKHITLSTVMNSCIAVEIPTFQNNFDADTSYIDKHPRLGDAFKLAYDKTVANIQITELVKSYKQFEEDQIFEINLGDNPIVASDRQLRPKEIKIEAHRQACAVEAVDLLEYAHFEDLAEYNCCYCGV